MQNLFLRDTGQKAPILYIAANFRRLAAKWKQAYEAMLRKPAFYRLIRLVLWITSRKAIIKATYLRRAASKQKRVSSINSRRYGFPSTR